MLSHFLRASSHPTINYIQNQNEIGASTTYTLTLGVTQPSGLYIVGVISENASVAGRTLSSITFEGNSMTSVINTASGTGNGGTLIGAIYAYRGSGVAATISVVFSGAMSRANIGVWRINNNVSDTVFDTDTSSISGVASNRTNTVNGLGYGNVGVSILANGNNASTSWTNATERYEAFSSGSGGSGADFTTTATGDRTITATATSGSNDGLVLVTGVWS